MAGEADIDRPPAGLPAIDALNMLIAGRADNVISPVSILKDETVIGSDEDFYRSEPSARCQIGFDDLEMKSTTQD